MVSAGGTRRVGTAGRRPHPTGSARRSGGPCRPLRGCGPVSVCYRPNSTPRGCRRWTSRHANRGSHDRQWERAARVARRRGQGAVRSTGSTSRHGQGPAGVSSPRPTAGSGSGRGAGTGGGRSSRNRGRAAGIRDGRRGTASIRPRPRHPTSRVSPWGRGTGRRTAGRRRSHGPTAGSSRTSLTSRKYRGLNGSGPRPIRVGRVRSGVCATPLSRLGSMAAAR